jgi:hypothetical protein
MLRCSCRSFTTDIQTAICNQNMKILDDMYTVAWRDGSWYTRDSYISQDKVLIYIRYPGSSESVLHHL